MNVKNFSKEIKKDLKETKEKSTETITIRVTSEEKKRFVRLAKACKIPPDEIYEIVKELSAIREIILEYCLEGEPVRAYVAAIERIMNTLFEHCKLFYDEGIFGAAFQKYCGDLDKSEAV